MKGLKEKKKKHPIQRSVKYNTLALLNNNSMELGDSIVILFILGGKLFLN